MEAGEQVGGLGPGGRAGVGGVHGRAERPEGDRAGGGRCGRRGGERRKQDAGQLRGGGEGDPGGERLAVGVRGVGLRDDRAAAHHRAVGPVREDLRRLAHARRPGGVGETVRERAQVMDY